MRRGWGVVALVLAGCAQVSGDGGSCTFTSECAEPLVCAARACRPQCRGARDCPDGHSCEPFGEGLGGVCVPPGDTLPCRFNSDCAITQVCVESTCRAQCATDRDCGEGECVEGSCTTPIATTPQPDGGTRTCPAGSVLCFTDGDCHDLDEDEAHCGSCGNACPVGAVCEAGACLCGGEPCRPPNDECADAIEIPIVEGEVSSIRTGTRDAENSFEDCSIDYRDLFYRFRLARRSVVALHVASYDTGTAELARCGEPIARCTPSDCGVGDATMKVRVLDPGEHVVMVAQPSSAEGDLRLTIHHVPMDDLPVEIVSATGAFSVSSSTLGAAASCGAGPRAAFAFAVCGTGSWTASSCGSTMPTRLELRDGFDGAVCAEGCMLERAFSNTSLQVLFVAGASATDTGDVVLEGSLP